jgi:hypothetical protein
MQAIMRGSVGKEFNPFYYNSILTPKLRKNCGKMRLWLKGGGTNRWHERIWPKKVEAQHQDPLH